VKARQEAGGRRQEEDHYSIKTGFGIISKGEDKKSTDKMSVLQEQIIN
jgi:hypothetical protein